MKSAHLHIIPAILSCLLCVRGMAQLTPNTNPLSSDSGTVDVPLVKSDPSAQMQHNLSLGIDTFYKWDSSFIFLHRYDKLYQNFKPYTDLGYNASPQKLLIFHPFIKPGFNVGFNPYPVQNKNPDSFVFYKANVPFTRGYYTQGGNASTMLNLMHTQNFSPTWNVSFDFSTVTNDELFNISTRTKHLHRGTMVGNHYKSKNGIFEQTLIFSWNRARREESHGLKNDTHFYRGFVPSTFLGRKWDNRRVEGFYIPAFKQASSVYKTSHHLLENKLKLIPGIYLFHRLDWSKDIYQYFEGSEIDSLFTRNDIFFDSSQTNDSTVWTQFKNSVGFGNAPSQNSLLAFRFFYSHSRGTYNTSYKTAPNVFYNQGLHAIVNVFPFNNKKIFNENSLDYYFSGIHALDFNLQSRLIFRPFKFLSLNAGYHSQKNTATQYQRQFSGNNFQYKKNYNPVFSNELNLGLSFSMSHIKLQLQAMAGTNKGFIYVDPTGNFTQLDAVVNYLRMEGQLNLRLGKFYLDQKFVLQSNDRNTILNLPGFSDLISLYFQGKILKKSMLARMGIDVFYTSEYTANTYLPYRGLFAFNDRGIKAGNYPIADIFFSGEVKTLMLFVKFQHFNSYWINYGFSNTFNSSTGNPILPANLRIGLIWRFHN